MVLGGAGLFDNLHESLQKSQRVSVAPTIRSRRPCCDPSISNSNSHMLAPPSNDGEGTDYELLSPEKRLELDDLRSRAIRRHLSKFTLVCEHAYLLASIYHMIYNNLPSPRSPLYITFVVSRSSTFITTNSH
jgi:hypothetical protein